MSLTSRVRSGTFWVLSVRGLSQALSLVTVPIMARLLSPDDYGLMGVVSVVMLIVEVLSRTGFGNALIQKSGEIDSYLDAAWTADLLRGLLQALLFILLASPIARFYRRDQLVALMVATAMVPLLQGMRSIGVTVLLFRRMDFRRLAMYEAGSMIFGDLVTVSLAFLFRNVWALVVARIVRQFYLVVVSYWIAPHRPRIEVHLDRWRELWTFGQWEWLSAVTYTLFHNGDDLLVGRILGTQALGYYRMAYRIANMATTEGVNAVRKVLFPAFSRIQDDTTRLRRAFLDFWQMSAILGFGFSATLYTVASPLVSVFLGSKWEPMIPALRVLTIWGGLQVLKTGTSPVFKSVNRPDWWAKSLALRVVVMGILIYPLSTRWGLVGTSVSVLIGSIVDFPVTMIWVSKAIDCHLSDLLKPLALPAIGCAVVALIAGLGFLALSDTSAWVKMLVTGGVAAGAFGGVILVGDVILQLELRAKMLKLVRR